MPLNINFNKTNELIRMMMPYLMQMKTYSAQDRLMRERAAGADVTARQYKEFETKINFDDYVKKAFVDTAKSNNAWDFHDRSAQIAETQGNAPLANQHRAAQLELSGPAIEASVNALGGKPGSADFMAWLKMKGPEGLKELLNEAGQSARSIASAGLETSRQGLDVQKLGLEKQKFGLEQQKFGAEQGVGGKAGKEYIDRWMKPLTDVINFLEPVARGDNVMTQMYQEPAGYMSSKLSEIQIRLNNGQPLTKEDEKTINEARDLKNLVRKYKNERLVGQTRGPGSATDIAETRQVEADLNKARMERTGMSTAAPSITIPANAPKAYNPTTGEMAYWDGTKWIIVK